jgi:hypothetical protein
MLTLFIPSDGGGVVDDCARASWAAADSSAFVAVVAVAAVSLSS